MSRCVLILQRWLTEQRSQCPHCRYVPMFTPSFVTVIGHSAAHILMSATGLLVLLAQLQYAVTEFSVKGITVGASGGGADLPEPLYFETQRITAS